MAYEALSSGATPIAKIPRDDADRFLNLFNMVGESPAFRRATSQILRLASSDAPVLIEGETGVGKELAARALHYLSARKEHPFIPVNCGAIPDSLIESELFGHERGAFTDAKTAHRGIIAQASKGTLFLDEVNALSHRAQTALLRFLHDMNFRPLGASGELKADVRIVAATNEALDQLIRARTFRADLSFRLNVLSIRIPPLRERAGDAELLARHFIDLLSVRYRVQKKRLDADAIASIRAYQWPGNVREL
ncbi:MAG TPA: sigma 54-interacting transcriptional regulator, partial [Candidatus Sulfotelmatobacter sp.]|nr:sigma 54-interacting transcriptional regulator [Candidatus Sulfotelmatobacter sp.]